MRDEENSVNEQDKQVDNNEVEAENEEGTEAEETESTESDDDNETQSEEGEPDKNKDEFDSLSTEELKEIARKQKTQNEKQQKKIAHDRKKFKEINRTTSLDPIEFEYANAIDSAETTAEKIELRRQLDLHTKQKEYAVEIDAQGRDLYSDWNAVMQQAASISPGAGQYLLSLGDPKRIYEAAKLSLGDDVPQSHQKEDNKKQEPKVIYKKVANKPVKKLVDSPNVSRNLSQAEKIERLKKIKRM